MTLRVLIVDDEESIRETLAMFVTDQGHTVVTAEDGFRCRAAQGLDCDKAFPCVDLALIDQNLPKLRGTDLIRLQLRHGCKALPADRILMSGVVTPQLREEGKALGCSVLQKPFRFRDLDGHFHRALERLRTQDGGEADLPTP